MLSKAPKFQKSKTGAQHSHGQIIVCRLCYGNLFQNYGVDPPARTNGLEFEEMRELFIIAMTTLLPLWHILTAMRGIRRSRERMIEQELSHQRFIEEIGRRRDLVRLIDNNNVLEIDVSHMDMRQITMLLALAKTMGLDNQTHCTAHQRYQSRSTGPR